MNARTIAIASVAVLMLFVMVMPAAADGIIIPEPVCPPQPELQQPCVDCVRPPIVPCPPVPPPLGSTPLSVKYHKVTVTIEDQVARTHVDQVFVNDSTFAQEGTYIFPLPLDATVSQFAMWVDGQKMEGKVLSREEARSVYESIVRRRRDPALLEYLNRGAFQASIFPIPPQGERRIEIEYTQVLVADGGLVHYIYPLNTEKFSARPLDSVSVSVDIRSKDALKAIYSPSHKVTIVRDGDHHATVGYEESRVKPDRDFELYYSVSQSDIGVNLLTFKQGNEDGFFLLLAAPKVEVNRDQVVSKDVIAVIDTSGSMDGGKIQQAKAALGYLLDHLNPEDRFNIIRFSTGVESYASGLRPATERTQAQRFVDGLRAAGNTDINRALLEALAMADKERPTILIFLTDGQPTQGVIDGAQIVANVKQASRGNVRLFAFGIGDDVNAVLLDTLSQDNRGVAAYVRQGQRIDEEVSAFYAKVSTPVLADLKLDWGGMSVSDVYPDPLPDLFVGSQLVLVGRYASRSSGPAQVKLSGVVNGSPQTFTYADLTFRSSGGADFIPRLWATRKIGYLLNQIRLRGEDKETIAQIVTLAVRYGIATPYTSFLVDERAQTEAGRQQIIGAQATAMPKAASGGAVPGMSGGVGAAPVQAAQDQQGLRSAESVVAPSGEYAAQIRAVGTKTFVLRNGVWTDAEYDPSKMTTMQVGFGSDDYFKLLAARPEWGQFFALGERVIVAPDGVDGKAYETVQGAGQPVQVPPAASATPEPTRKPSVSATPEPTRKPGPGTTPTAFGTGNPPVATPGSKPASGGLCGGAAAMVMSAVAVVVLTRRTKTR
jgi:Ca-activated chloride channel homolog